MKACLQLAVGLSLRHFFDRIGLRGDLVLAGFFALFVVASTFLTRSLAPPLEGAFQALGPHALSLFVAFVLPVSYGFVAAIAGRMRGFTAWIMVLLALLALVPSLGAWHDPIIHAVGDDSSRYSVYAREMIRDRSFWGHDYTFEGLPQPLNDQVGVRYVHAFFMLLLGGEVRGIHILQLLLSVGVLALFFRTAVHRLAYGSALALLALVVATAPYFAKNLVYTYAAWLAVLTYLGAATCLLERRWFGAALLLGLSWVVRSNFLIFAPLCFVFLVPRKTALHCAAFAVPFLLPLFHNLYYFGLWQLVPSNTGGFLLVSEHGRILGLGEALVHKLLHHVGYCGATENLGAAILGNFFLPWAPLLLLAFLVAAPSWRHRITLVVLCGAAIGPPTLFGGASYPRFEFASYTASLLALAVYAEQRYGLRLPRAAASLRERVLNWPAKALS